MRLTGRDKSRGEPRRWPRLLLVGVLGLLYLGIVWRERILFWSRGATPADKTGLLAYWSFDDCTAKDTSSNGFTGIVHHARCIKGVSGNALLLSKDGGYLVFPRIYDSILDEMSVTSCRWFDEKWSGQKGWVATAMTKSYSTYKLKTYLNGALESVEDLPTGGHFPRGDWEFGLWTNRRTKRVDYTGGAVDEMRLFSRELNPDEILLLSKICLKGRGEGLAGEPKERNYDLLKIPERQRSRG